MFEDIVRHSKYRQAGLKRSRYERLVDLQVRKNLVEEVERLRGSVLDPASRKELLRRASDIIKSRSLPEETYEFWHSGKLGETPLIEELLAEAAELEKHASADINNETNNTNDVESDNSDDESDSLDSDSESEEIEDLEEDVEEQVMDDEVHPDTLYAVRKLKKWESGLDTARSWARDRFILTKAGMEFPGLHDERQSVVKSHITNLLNLLHVNILRQHWDLAYRAFSLLLRFDYVDLRAIWPLGVEILTRRKEEMVRQNTGSRLELLKCRRFLEWLELVYPVLPSVLLTIQSRVGPVFRAGSRRHAPAYVAAGLWQLLVEKQYVKLRESLDELLLVPPYSIDGGFFYIQALCCLCENIHLADIYVHFDTRGFPVDADIGDLAEDMMLLGSKETIQARVLSNISKIEELITSCESLGFEYAKWDFDAQMKRVKGYMEGAILTLIPEKAVSPEAPESLGFSFLHGKIERAPTGPHTIAQEHLSRFTTSNSRKSWVWNWFTKNDEATARCLKCLEEVQKSSGGSTKQFMKHLRKHGINDRTMYNEFIQLRSEEPVKKKPRKRQVAKAGSKPTKRSNKEVEQTRATQGIPSPPATAGDLVTKEPPEKRRKVPLAVRPSAPSRTPQASDSARQTAEPDTFSNPPDSPPRSELRHSPAPSIKDEQSPIASPAPVADPHQDENQNDIASPTPLDSNQQDRDTSERQMPNESLEKDASVASDRASTVSRPDESEHVEEPAQANDSMLQSHSDKSGLDRPLSDSIPQGPPETPRLPDNPDLAIAVKEEILDELNCELLAGVEAAQTPVGPQLSSPAPQTPPPGPFSPEPDSPESQNFMSAKRKPVRRQSNFSPESTFTESQGDADMSIRFREFAVQTKDPFRVDRSILEDTEEEQTIQLPTQHFDDIPDTLRFGEESPETNKDTSERAGIKSEDEDSPNEQHSLESQSSASEYGDAQSRFNSARRAPESPNDSSEETQFFSFQDTA